MLNGKVEYFTKKVEKLKITKKKSGKVELYIFLFPFMEIQTLYLLKRDFPVQLIKWLKQLYL